VRTRHLWGIKEEVTGSGGIKTGAVEEGKQVVNKNVVRGG
jgi:hypothetical protein